MFNEILDFIKKNQSLLVEKSKKNFEINFDILESIYLSIIEMKKFEEYIDKRKSILKKYN